jgi:HK97 family phage portal protein
MAYIPAKTIRKRRKDGSDRGSRNGGHGYAQKRGGDTVYLAEAGDRQVNEDDPDDEPTYVDKETGETADDATNLDNSPANEVLFIPNPHPNAVYYGIPNWVAELQTIIADHEARRFNRKRLENDLMLDYIVKVEGGQLTEKTRSDLRSWLKEMRESDEPELLYLEAEELAETASLDGDTSQVEIHLEPAAHFGNEDASFVDYRENNESDIAQVHEVPMQALNRHDATNSNTEEALRQFDEEYIRPNQRRFEERLYRTIHQQILGVEDWKLRFVSGHGEDEEKQAKIADIRIRAGQFSGVMTVDEARQELGLEPFDDSIGDMPLKEFQSLMGGGAGGEFEQLLTEQIEDVAQDLIDDVEQKVSAERRIQSGAAEAD